MSHSTIPISPLGSTLTLSLPTPLTLARGTATAFGLLGIFMGGRAMLFPSAYAVTFGFPASSATTATAAGNPFIPVAGGRALASALGTLACVYLGYDRAVGVLFVCGGVVGLVDGWSVVKFGGGEAEAEAGKASETESETESEKRERRAEVLSAAWGHWGVVGFAVGVGAWMVVNCTN